MENEALTFVQSPEQTHVSRLSCRRVRKKSRRRFRGYGRLLRTDPPGPAVILGSFQKNQEVPNMVGLMVAGQQLQVDRQQEVEERRESGGASRHAARKRKEDSR